MAITLDGTTGTTTPNVVLPGSASGTITLAAPSAAGTQSYTLPTAVPAVSGYALTATTAGVMSWAAASATPGGSNQQVQFNNSSAFGGSANFVWDGTYVGIGTSSPSTYSDSTPGITTYNSSAGGRSGIVMGGNATATDDLFGYISFFNSNSSNTNYRMASMRCNRGSDANSSYLTWHTANSANPAESLRLNGVGTVILKGGSTSATGVGITFPATQSSSSDVNTLDDYEEGTWTPAYTTNFSGTYATQVGRYTKIGRVVTAYFFLKVSTTTGSGNLAFGTLPFACANVTDQTPSIAVGWAGNWGTNTPFSLVFGGPNSTVMNLKYRSAANGSIDANNIAASDLGVNCFISGVLVYETAT